MDELVGQRKPSARKGRTLVGPVESSLSAIKKAYTDSVNGRPFEESTPIIGSDKRERFDDRMGNFVSNSKTKAPSRKELNEQSLYAPEINGLANLHRSHDSRRNLHGMSTLKVPMKDVDFMTGGTRLQPINSKGGFHNKRLSEKSDKYELRYTEGNTPIDGFNSVGRNLLIDDVDVSLKPAHSNFNRDLQLQKTATLCSDLSM
jgi:hypothetical protein